MKWKESVGKLETMVQSIWSVLVFVTPAALAIAARQHHTNNFNMMSILKLPCLFEQISIR